MSITNDLADAAGIVRAHGYKALSDRLLALAEQPAQESVAMYRNKCSDGSRCLHGCHANEPCYTTPQAQPAREPLTLPPGRCASEWGGRATGPCLYTDDKVFEILAAHGITKGGAQ